MFSLFSENQKNLTISRPLNLYRYCSVQIFKNYNKVSLQQLGLQHTTLFTLQQKKVFLFRGGILKSGPTIQETIMNKKPTIGSDSKCYTHITRIVLVTCFNGM